MNNIENSSQPHEKHNFIVFVVNQVLVRIGWIFKNETAIIPRFLELHSPSGVIRGFLPLIFGIGQSLPLFLIAHPVSKMTRKKGVFVLSAFGTALPWFVLALILGWTDYAGRVIVGFFLVSHTLSWLMLGCNRLAIGVLQGKLIRVDQRGRLLAYDNSIGCLLAVAAFWLVMPHWLREGNTNYAWIFGTAGGFFGLAACASFYFRETPDWYSWESAGSSGPPSLSKFLSSGLMLVRYDRNFRILAAVIVLFHLAWLLFPHYTVFGMRRLGLAPANFFIIISVQNVVTAFGSWAMGNLADRRGNRLVLRILVFIGVIAPLAAIAISRLPMGADFYWFVFAFLGFFPASNRVVMNYTLEIAPRAKHSQYLGVINLIQACSLFASPLIGLLIDRLSFEPVFISGAVLALSAGLLTFRLTEPRRFRIL